MTSSYLLVDVLEQGDMHEKLFPKDGVKRVISTHIQLQLISPFLCYQYA